MDGSQLAVRDRALCTELVYGVLRTQPYLERRVAEYGSLKRTDLAVLVHLLTAVYQIEFLDRVPSRAAVHEAVALVRRNGDDRAAGFVNAVLRRLSESAETRKSSLAQAVFESTPSWLRKRLVRDLTEPFARVLLCPDYVPQLTLRLREGAEEPQFFLEHTERCQVPGAYRYTGGGDPRRYPEFAEGKFIIQELGAQMVAHSVSAQPGERILDVCAGRGQKTFLLSEKVGPTGQVVATDLHQHKVDVLLQQRGEGVSGNVHAFPWDWTIQPPSELLGAFDRVLVDAPCTGVGTIHRRPEIARRLNPEDPARMSELQREILCNAFLALKAGGVLVFATCSVLREEGEAVLERSISPAEYGPTAPKTLVDSMVFGDGGEPTAHFRLLPHLHGTDGYSVVRIRKN